MFCTACGAAVEVDNFCTNCGARLHEGSQVAAPTIAPAQTSVPAGIDPVRAVPASAETASAMPVGADHDNLPADETPSVASRVWDGVERVGDAVTTVFAVVVGLGWILFGIIVFVAAGNGYGTGWSWLIGTGMIVYGIFLVMPTRGTKFIIY